MINKQEFYRRFDQVVPGTSLSGTDNKFNDSEIYFERISLAGLEEMHRYSLDERLYEYFEFKPFERLEETKAYLQKLLVRMSSVGDERTAMYWFVRRKSDDYLIGTAGLVNMNYSRQSIEWGYGVDPQLWGTGFILQIQEMLKHYVFEILELNRLFGVTMVENERTISTVIAAGMKPEGIARQHYCKNGSFHDGWQYGMIRQDYFQTTNIVSGNSKIYTIDDVIEIVSSILTDEEITPESNMVNTESWDSLNHILIMVSIFEQTKINFSPIQIANATSVKMIAKLINKV